MLILALLQATSGPVDPAAVPRGCRPPGDPGEVVVCGRPVESRYRLKRTPPMARREGLPPAAVGIPGVGALALEAQQGNLGPIPTKRALVTLKVPF